MRSSIVVVLTLAASTGTRAGTLDPPAPAAPTPRVIHEDTPSPLYYRVPSDIIAGLGRAAYGVAMRSSDQAHDGGVAFALDALYGAAIHFGRGARTRLWIEGGYSYSRFHDHLFVLGAGPSVRWLGPKLGTDGAIGLALVPHAVVGSINGDFGYGVRTSAIASFGIVGLELAHQRVVVGSERIDEVHLQLLLPVVVGGDW